MSAIMEVREALGVALEHLALTEVSTGQADIAAAHGLELAETVGMPVAIEKLRRVKATTASAVDELGAIVAKLERARQVVAAMADAT